MDNIFEEEDTNVNMKIKEKPIKEKKKTKKEITEERRQELAER